MKNWKTYLGYGTILILVIALIYISGQPNKKTQSSETTLQKNSQKTEVQAAVKPAEKIQLFLFHNTQRCHSCINIGKYAQETLEQKFPAELKSGKIEFQEINIDSPKNKDLVNKFKATGSALFLNPIVDGQDNIKEDVQVWRLVSNKPAFESYLTNKLSEMLGGGVAVQEK